MDITNFDRESMINIMAITMLILFNLDVILLFMAVKFWRRHEKDSFVLSLVQVWLIVICVISILISFTYWCILR